MVLLQFHCIGISSFITSKISTYFLVWYIQNCQTGDQLNRDTYGECSLIVKREV